MNPQAIKAIKKSGFHKSVTVVGGGNIGSSLVHHFARSESLERLTIIDFDKYEFKNITSQDILTKDVRKLKADVLARRARLINPNLKVEAIVDRVENVPLGKLRASVIAACLDSKEARRIVNQAAWRLGVPWIDAGVNARDGLFARVTPYLPDLQSPCLECAWDTDDYDTLEQVYPCGGKLPSSVPTNAPSSLGALTAALQAIKCEKVISGDTDNVVFGRQVLVDAANDSLNTMVFRRNKTCKFDHRIWQIRAFRHRPAKTTIADVLELIRELFGTVRSACLGVEEQPLVCGMRCSGCGRTQQVLRLRYRLSMRDCTCTKCGSETMPVGFSMVDRLNLSNADKKLLRRPLSSIGLRAGDVFSVYNSYEGEAHFEITCD